MFSSGQNGLNNYIGVAANSIFQAYAPSGGFSFTDNYHLVNPILYIGTDNTQVGIYGGAFSWKEGSIPFNPHIQIKQISPTTNNNGLLPVNIRVKAQDH